MSFYGTKLHDRHIRKTPPGRPDGEAWRRHRDIRTCRSWLGKAPEEVEDFIAERNRRTKWEIDFPDKEVPNNSTFLQKADWAKAKTNFIQFPGSIRMGLRYQIPALATLIYVDLDYSLPTGQWSAVSATV